MSCRLGSLTVLLPGKKKEDVMEQRGVLLRGIAKVLNAGGCALLNLYDAATSIKTSKPSVLPGEKGRLQEQLGESEKRIEKIKQRMKAIEEEEKAAREAAIKSAETKAEPVADAGEPAASAAPIAGEGSTDAVPEEAKEEEAKEIVAEAAETPEHELQKDTAEPEAPVAGGASPGAVPEEKAAAEGLEKMLKSDLLKLCKEKGIEANERMTRAVIIELILGR
jgi:hypothetical protein